MNQEEYLPILEQYSLDGYEMYSRNVGADQWGNKSVARDYLRRYWLPSDEHRQRWEQMQDQIFINQASGLPDMLFAPGYELLVTIGGCLFVKEDFALLQECAKSVCDRFLFVIENTFGGRLREPAFRMKFPVDISWDELAGGSFASAIMLEMPHKEYFVFGDTGCWGRYSANDYDLPVDILGFTPHVASVFRERFACSEAGQAEIAKVLPPAYWCRS